MQDVIGQHKSELEDFRSKVTELRKELEIFFKKSF